MRRLPIHQSRGICLAFVFIAGCAQNASFVQLRPAEADISGIATLAVLDVYGREDMAAIATDQLLDALRSANCYRVVDQAELQQYTSQPFRRGGGLPNVPAVMQAARQSGIDAVLLPILQFRESDGVEYGTRSVRFGDPNVAAAISYRLIRAQDGAAIDSSIVHSDYYQGDFGGPDVSSESETVVLARLTREGTAKLVGRLVPHEAPTDVSLAVADWNEIRWNLRRGNSLASRGDWEGATGYWQAALEDDPECDDALYNLGLASEASGNVERARRFFEAASQLRPNSLYREALARLDASASDYRTALTQRSQAAVMEGISRVATAASHREQTPLPWAPPRKLPPVGPPNLHTVR